MLNSMLQLLNVYRKYKCNSVINHVILDFVPTTEPQNQAYIYQFIYENYQPVSSFLLVI